MRIQRENVAFRIRSFMGWNVLPVVLDVSDVFSVWASTVHALLSVDFFLFFLTVFF